MCPDWQVFISKELTELKKSFLDYYWNFEGKFEFLMNTKYHGHNLTQSSGLSGFGQVRFSIKKLLK